MTKSDTWGRLAVETPEGPVLLFDAADIFYLEAEEHDTLVRTARGKPYRSQRRLGELLARLPRPPFFRCHEKYVVNLARVRSIEKDGRDRQLRLDPPVNKVLPLARGRASALQKVLGI
jgi:DNA-binding LytR/AlgR family response regulator